MNEIIINEKISYIKASNHPLSADIGIIKNANDSWLFDVGNDETSIENLKDDYYVVLSHFHIDHIGNLNKLKIKKLYVSKETYNHLPKEIKENNTIEIVDKITKIDNLLIFPIPSSHAKGCLGLEIDETYAFLGDATYCKYKDGQCMYNVQLLKAEIEALKKLNAPNFLISHHFGFICKKDNVIKELEAIYNTRMLNRSEIIINR